ncbi:restriction endonuclease subunit S [Marinospirillum insulare]|uniref:Type I restriction endonuclease EcoAI subunit S n=1 Tax=Marinospirillum insulare TaxID=217169 RepID=A0ABQ5ZT26_9GAMM|nr:restriction endonuclease subunit S [Marinospirillum insulare]GLR63295.1 type I restriction endonuclease EcoAI subunit S [Marinospirillum insulare]
MAAIENLITENMDVWTSAIKQRATQGRGSSKKQELYGIQKLRELILELAVRGLLVPQDPNDEPASVLLEKIAAEREQLVKEKKIRKPKKIPSISIDEKYGFLPHGWEYVRLNDIGDWGAGATPKRSNSEFYGGNIPWFKSGELVADYISNSEETITEDALKKTSLRYNKAGDVLLAMYGATIGKAAILSVPATTNQAVCACTTFTGFSNVFLLTLLKAYKPRFIGMGAGGAQPNISREKIIATVIALPPANEQKRIVAKVDELMALCDQLEEQQENSLAAHQQLVEVLLTALTQAADAEAFQQAWTRLAANFETLFTTENSIDQLKQTLLQLAVMGKLVPQDPNDEPVCLLLDKITIKKEAFIKERKIRKTKPMPKISNKDIPFQAPHGWVWARLGDLGIGATGKTPSTKTAENFDGEIPFIGPGQITPSGKLLESDKTLTKEGLKHSSEAVYGDILMVCIGGSVGKSVIADRRVAFNQQINSIHPFEVMSEFLFLTVNTKTFYQLVVEKSSGSATPIINRSKWEELPVPIAPLNEQKRIVAKVDQLFAICDQLKAKIRTAQTTQLQLADALTSQAVQ